MRPAVGLHYGTYDYSAALGIAAAYQSLEHPAADYAKAVMQVAAAGTGVARRRLHQRPSRRHRDDVLAAWRLHARLVRRSLERGFYQGWDLHPGQLVTRYAATYAFYREGLPAAATRLRDAAKRSATGQEEPATIRALADFLTEPSTAAPSRTECAELTNLTADQAQCRPPPRHHPRTRPLNARRAAAAAMRGPARPTSSSGQPRSNPSRSSAR